uniref:Polyprotein n=1 Tax=Peronospora matthiolae TaxID=2874970 RepID=A0AAV1TCI3_9STRA
MVNDSPVMFKSKLLNDVPLSTAEAEYVALLLCIQEIFRTKRLLVEMKVKDDTLVVVHKDNPSAIAIAKNEGYQSGAKHTDVRYHFVREQVMAKVIRLEHIGTKSHLSRLSLTKAIPTNEFQFLVAKTNVGVF